MNDSPMAGKALSDTYDQFRDEIHSALPTDLHAEFDRLFPRLNQEELQPDDILEIQQAASAAKTKLTALSGWLEGLIESEKSVD